MKLLFSITFVIFTIPSCKNIHTAKKGNFIIDDKYKHNQKVEKEIAEWFEKGFDGSDQITPNRVN